MVVMDFESDRIGEAKIPNASGGTRWAPPRYSRWVEVPLYINNETRHAVRVVSTTWVAPKTVGEVLNLEHSQTDVAHRIVKAESQDTLVFSYYPRWKDLSEALVVMGSTSSSMAETLRSNSSMSPSITISLELKIESRAFWRSQKTMAAKVIVPESTISNAIRDQ